MTCSNFARLTDWPKMFEMERTETTQSSHIALSRMRCLCSLNVVSTAWHVRSTSGIEGGGLIFAIEDASSINGRYIHVTEHDRGAWILHSSDCHRHSITDMTSRSTTRLPKTKGVTLIKKIMTLSQMTSPEPEVLETLSIVREQPNPLGVHQDIAIARFGAPPCGWGRMS